jgi:ArsR family transcriptional regulator
MKSSRIAPSDLDQSTRTLRAFADPVRLRLLNLLAGEQEEICVCHLHEALDLPQPTISRHLAYLRKHGLVIGRKEGLWVHYRLAGARTGLHRILLGCLGSCLGDAQVFLQDRKRLERRIECCGGEDSDRGSSCD